MLIKMRVTTLSPHHVLKISSAIQVLLNTRCLDFQHGSCLFTLRSSFNTLTSENLTNDRRLTGAAEA